MSNQIFQESCSFCLLQIGGVVKYLSEGLTEKYPQIRWRGISGMRNIIAHGYENINLNALWFSITEDIPVLKAACKKILKDIGAQ
ncbi:MAG: DUF86 domain-containing protein [Methanomassiliicoccaceae archaeon]|nr:DUF86 domain-containing protein [Methanomassiliicoccaceae archaeon]